MEDDDGGKGFGVTVCLFHLMVPFILCRGTTEYSAELYSYRSLYINISHCCYVEKPSPAQCNQYWDRECWVLVGILDGSCHFSCHLTVYKFLKEPKASLF